VKQNNKHYVSIVSIYTNQIYTSHCVAFAGNNTVANWYYIICLEMNLSQPTNQPYKQTNKQTNKQTKTTPFINKCIKFWLKILWLYCEPLKIGHNFCSMLSILHKTALQMELQHFMTNKRFCNGKCMIKHNNNKTTHRHPYQTRNSNLGSLVALSCVSCLPPRHINVSIAVNVFKC